jgi:4-amino-4-deoxy-L-arabinose transferase-like glycosyltransferase
MLAEGRVLVPVLHGEPYYHKPPLLYWLVMAAYRVFGVEDWVARLVPGTCGVLIVLVTYLWGKRILGAVPAFAGALVLALSARFVYLGRMLTMDCLLCLWVTASLAAAHVAGGSPRPRARGPALRWTWWLAAAAACGFGILTKGPVALVLAAFPVLVFQVLDPRAARPRWRHWLGYLGVTAAIAGPWYAAVGWRNLEFVRDFFWTHNVQRYVAPLDHAEPVWFYVPGLLLGMLPWSLLLYPLMKFLSCRSGALAARRPAAIGFFLLAALWCLAFYSLAGCKRAGYVLPAMPPLALALGWALAKLLVTKRRLLLNVFNPRQRTLLAHRACLLVVAAGGLGSLAAVIVGIDEPASGLALAAAAAAAFATLWWRGPARKPVTAWAGCAALTLAVLLVAIHDVFPGYARRFSLRKQVRPIAPLAADAGRPVACYPRRWDSVSFYLQRGDVKVYGPAEMPALAADILANPGMLVFVKSDDGRTSHMTEFLAGLPGSLEFVPRGRVGRVTAGVVRRRSTAPDSELAKRWGTDAVQGREKTVAIH